MSAESDPNGLSPHEPGAKLDAGKNRVGMVLAGFADALEAVGRVGTQGAQKYTDGGWKLVPDGYNRYTDAMWRHWLKEQKESVDKDSGLSHQAHLCWNALARLQLMIDASSPSKSISIDAGSGMSPAMGVCERCCYRFLYEEMMFIRGGLFGDHQVCKECYPYFNPPLTEKESPP